MHIALSLALAMQTGSPQEAIRNPEAASLALSQQHEGNSETILVEGVQTIEDQARQEAREFVRATGIAAGNRPTARWEQPICPRVFGVRSNIAEHVERKIREIANGVGARVAKAPCRPNVSVTFASNAAAFVRVIAKRSPARISEVPLQRREGLLHGTAPIRWWYSTETRSSDGMAGSVDPPVFALGNSTNGGSVVPMGEGGTSMLQYRWSIISTQSKREIRAATVVIDAHLCEGRSLDAVASYSAMVALAEIAWPVPLPSSSILALFSDGNVRSDLTSSDLALLQAVYRLRLDRDARAQRGALVEGLIGKSGAK